MSTRLRTIGCRTYSTILFAMAAAMLVTGAHAANERAIKAMRYADAQRYRQLYGCAYTGTRPFVVTSGGAHLSIRGYQASHSIARRDWHRQESDRLAKALMGEE